MSASRWTRISWPIRRRSSRGRTRPRSGYGALDDFGVHPLSLIHTLLGGVARVCGHMSKAYPDRPLAGGGRRPVETHDIATVLIELDERRVGPSRLQPRGMGAQGSHLRADLRIAGHSRVRPGALQRNAALRGRRTGGDARVPHHPGRARTTRLTTASRRLRAMGSASTTSR